jgi:hypothetical protein
MAEAFYGKAMNKYNPTPPHIEICRVQLPGLFIGKKQAIFIIVIS